MVMEELQEKKYSCGPAALRYALYMLGHRVSEAALRKRAGTIPQGTDAQDLLKAIKHYGHKAKEYEVSSAKQAWNRLRFYLSRGRPVLLCCDEWGHWITATGRFGSKVWIYDPDSTTSECRRRYSALQLYSEEELISRWRYLNEFGKTSYSAICITV